MNYIDKYILDLFFVKSKKKTLVKQFIKKIKY